MDQNKFNQIYGDAIDNIRSQEEIDEQSSRTEKNIAEAKAQQQQVALQQQKQDFNEKILTGGFILMSVIVVTVCTVIILKTFRRKDRTIR